tara:strand:- start:6635 stop:7093 length:459 start_codon:yes stop_codon:yes gene_type:complete
LPYQPNTPDRYNREQSFRYMFLSLGANCVLIFDVFIALPNIVRVLAMGSVVGGLLVAGLMASRVDDYFRALCYSGQQWTVSGIAAYLLFYLFNAGYDTGYGAGFALGSEGMAPEREPLIALSPLLTDGYVVALSFAMLFFLGFAYASLRARW